MGALPRSPRVFWGVRCDYEFKVAAVVPGVVGDFVDAFGDVSFRRKFPHFKLW